MRKRKPEHQWAVRPRRLLGVLALAALAGCGGASGPPRYHLTGAATYGGRPIPEGTIVFEPDVSAGNSGPGSRGDIAKGQYQTREDKGIVGGAYIVTITGSPEGGGSLLFAPYRTNVSLKQEDATYDFDVPLEGDSKTARRRTIKPEVIKTKDGETLVLP